MRQTCRSPSRIESMKGLYGSSMEPRRDFAGICGEKSSMARYLRIVGCETPVRLCISAFVSPWRLMSRILSIVGMSIILSASLPSSW